MWALNKDVAIDILNDLGYDTQNNKPSYWQGYPSSAQSGTRYVYVGYAFISGVQEIDNSGLINATLTLRGSNAIVISYPFFAYNSVEDRYAQFAQDSTKTFCVFDGWQGGAFAFVGYRLKIN